MPDSMNPRGLPGAINQIGQPPLSALGLPTGDLPCGCTDDHKCPEHEVRRGH